MLKGLKTKSFENNKLLLLFIPLILSTIINLWNIPGFPSIHVDEGHYMRKAMSTIQGEGLQPQDRYFAPYFGQILMGGLLGVIGYPDILNPKLDTASMESLYLVPRLIMSIFAILDTFLVFKIAEKRYGVKIAFIAAVLFAVMPYGWLLKRIFLETIQLPLLLTSILLVLYLKKDPNIINSPKLELKSISLILFSGIFLGLAIFTKIPIFVMIPLIGYLVYTNSNNGIRSLALWFIPVLVIPLLWPAHAYLIGDFGIWLDDVIHQTQRESKPLINSLTTYLENDPVIFSLGFAGIIYSAIRRDYFILLYSIPFLLFLYWIDFVSSFHIVPLFPVFVIAGARLIVELSSLVPNIKIAQTLPYVIVSAIAVFCLVAVFLFISIDTNSVFLQTYVTVTQHLQKANGSATLVGSPVYLWIPHHIFDLSFEDRSYYSTRAPKTENLLIVSDSAYEKLIKQNITRGIFHYNLYSQTHIIDSIEPDQPIPKYKFKIYPYSNLKQSPILKHVDIRANY